MEDSETKRRGRPPGSVNVRPDADPSTVNVLVARDFWNDAGERVAAGTVIAVTVKAALRGVKAGSFDIIED